MTNRRRDLLASFDAGVGIMLTPFSLSSPYMTRCLLLDQRRLQDRQHGGQGTSFWVRPCSA